MKTRSIENIEHAMEGVDAASMRYRVLQSAKSFKTSWIELGQTLYTVWKDKLYRDWGFSTFDAYTQREIGIRKPTALKLLRSYYFLEKEEPVYLKKELSDEDNIANVPSYESVDVLRRASINKDMDKTDYNRIKTYVLEKGKDAKDVRRDIASIIKQREELQPEEAYEKKRITVIKRLISSLKSVKKEIEATKLLPAKFIKEITTLINNLETEIT